jgi:hypothetical protein
MIRIPGSRPYNIVEHRHRFSTWAAARATQRKFLKTAVLQKALEDCGIREFLGEADALKTDRAQFRVRHERWCRKIADDLSYDPRATFGRAAKLVAVYLKSMVVLSQPDTSLARVAYPPIDRTLLQNLARAPRIHSPYKREWAKVNWTQLDELEYYTLVDQFRDLLPDEEPFWKLEEFWTGSESDED